MKTSIFNQLKNSTKLAEVISIIESTPCKRESEKNEFIQFLKDQHYKMTVHAVPNAIRFQKQRACNFLGGTYKQWISLF